MMKKDLHPEYFEESKVRGGLNWANPLCVWAEATNLAKWKHACTTGRRVRRVFFRELQRSCDAKCAFP